MLRLSRRLTNQRFPRWFSSSFQNKDSSPSEEEASTSSSSAEWIPPNSPLHGDRDHSQLIRRQAEMDRVEEALFTTNESDSDEVTLKRLEEALEQEERLEKERLTDFENENDQDNVDWLQTRRKVLGGKEDSESIVPVIHRQLFSEHEVVSLLQSFGGSNITVLQDDTEYSRMGGAVAMVLCTASNEFYVHSITKFLVDHMKERELHNIGVLGAQMGKHFLQANNRSNWNVVDCQNYIVHIFDQDTRHTLNLEALWSGKDPIWNLDPNNDDAVEDYIAENHVPFEYGPNPDDNFRDSSISKLQRQQWLAPHRPVISTQEKLRDRRSERRRRRERKEQESRDYY